VPWGAHLLTPAVELFIDAFNTAPWNDEWTVASASRRLRDLQATPGFEGAALLTDGEVTAFIGGYRQRWWDDTDHFYIAELAVRRAVHRAGYGTRLLRAFIDGLVGVSTYYLLTEADGPAHAFYVKAGFRPARRQGVMTMSAAPAP